MKEETGLLQRPPVVKRSELKDSPDFYGNPGESLLCLDYSCFIATIAAFMQ